ncbi:MAG: FHA domain-containing protein [Deltaproteobacteria bacterium]|nr:FHA domain-containing protein [Deltaproteobacteria bacterium]
MTTSARRHRFAPALAGLFAALTVLSGIRTNAYAVEVRLATKASDAPAGAEPKEDGSDAPTIEATIIDGPALPVDKLTLVQPPEGAVKTPVSIKATSLKKFTEGNETLAITFLVEGHALFMGMADDADKGVFKSIGPAIDAATNAGPPGSKGELIVYGNSPVVKVPMGDLTALSGGALGSLNDYQGVTTRELVAGVNQAFADLKGVTAVRKVLIIIGDGTDTNADAAKEQLKELKKQFESNKIDVYAVFYQVDGFDGDQSVVKSLAPGVKTANSKDNIAAQVAAIIASINNRYYVTFPGYDVKNKVGFTWDGKDHQFTLKLDQEENDAGTVALVPIWNAPVEKKPLPWLWIILGSVLGIGLIAVLVAVVTKKKVAPPPPMVVAAPPPPVAAPPPPAPAGPMKTMMVNLASGDGDGFPIVGWLVPLNGPNQFQTFKLKSGPTIIGTGGAANVVINDGYMSTEHAQILATPQGFILKDGGSTNGCLVNEQRTSTHELVDNDVIMMGKTNFKFKTTI